MGTILTTLSVTWLVVSVIVVGMTSIDMQSTGRIDEKQCAVNIMFAPITIIVWMIQKLIKKGK